MGTVVGWRGVGVRLEGEGQLVAAVTGGLPGFFGGDLTAVVTGRLHQHDDTVTLELPDDLGVSGPDGPEILRACASRIELAIADRLPGVVAVHAGVVAVRDRVILVPGSSMAGKSTLVQALVTAGATYLSDEFALLDRDGAVHAYPRRMTIRTPDGSRRVTPARVRAADAPPLPLGLVAAIAYSPAGWEVAPMRPAAAVLELVRNAVNVRRDPVAAMEILARAVESSEAVAGTRGEASDAAATILDEFRERDHDIDHE